MAQKVRKFQAGLNTTAIRQKRQLNALSLRKEQREAKLQQKRCLILHQEEMKSLSDSDINQCGEMAKMFIGSSLSDQPKIITKIAEYADHLLASKSDDNEEKMLEENDEDEKIEQYLDKLFNVGVVRRDKAINLFRKILSNVIEFPNEEKYQSLNLEKITTKFTKFQCPFMIELMWFAGFCVDGDRLRMRENKIKHVLSRLEQRIKENEMKLEEEKRRVIEENKQRLNNKADKKKKNLKNKILSQHNEQMKLAKKGIYNVKACVSDRKGKGGNINTLGL